MQQPRKYKDIFEEYLHDLNLASGYGYNVQSTKQWIRYLLKYKTKDKQREILSQYREIYLTHYNNEPLEHKKENAGEFKANVWLREIVK